MNIFSYGKILALGATRSENALIGPVVIQEKVDGSQIRFGVVDGELIIASKAATIQQDNPPKMFQKAVDYLVAIKALIPEGMVFYGEFLEKPKHNVLAYERTPMNNIVLFDILRDGKWVSRDTLCLMSGKLGMDYIPVLFEGEATVETIKELLTKESFLGKEIIEGVVIKNYNQTVLLGGQVFTLMTKYVREDFKERHNAEWKTASPKGFMEDYKLKFRTEARWIKTIQHMREANLLDNSPKDIGPLLKEIQQDIVLEEQENIKNELYKRFIDDILRASVNGFPQFYKDKLLENLNENPTTETTEDPGAPVPAESV